MDTSLDEAVNLFVSSLEARSQNKGSVLEDEDAAVIVMPLCFLGLMVDTKRGRSINDGLFLLCLLIQVPRLNTQIVVNPHPRGADASADVWARREEPRAGRALVDAGRRAVESRSGSGNERNAKKFQ